MADNGTFWQIMALFGTFCQTRYTLRSFCAINDKAIRSFPFKDPMAVRPSHHGRTALSPNAVRPDTLWTYDQASYRRTSMGKSPRKIRDFIPVKRHCVVFENCVFTQKDIIGWFFLILRGDLRIKMEEKLHKFCPRLEASAILLLKRLQITLQTEHTDIVQQVFCPTLVFKQQTLRLQESYLLFYHSLRLVIVL